MTILDSTQNEILEDIINVSRDVLTNTDNINLYEISELVVITLQNMYDKKFHKYFYNEIIEQIISKKFGYYNKKYCFQKNKDYLVKRFEELKLKPQPDQRSDLWYAKRYNSIGASEVASIFNKNPFCTYNKYVEKKSKKANNPTPLEFNVYTHHGVKYEPIVQQLYCIRENTQIVEFGSIDHEKYSFISASPDGITLEGTMLEIKCPWKREIIGIPPIYYWYQMQQQLEVCKLNKCDFVECKIFEYQSWNDFLDDNYEGDVSKNKFNLEKGCIIEFIKSTDNKNEFDYIYPETILTSKKDIIDFHKKSKLLIESNNDNEFVRIIFWGLEVYSKISIYRNNYWWKTNIPVIQKFWNLVLDNRKQNVVLPNKNILKKNYKKKKDVETYSFLYDSDDE